MARPLKTNADYFPHDSDLRNDRRCKALRSKFGAEGYGVFHMLLEALAHSDRFEIAYRGLEIELLAGDLDIDSSKLQGIIQYLLTVELLELADQRLTSPLLANLKEILSESRDKERRIKNKGKPEEQVVFRAENPVSEQFSPLENAQSKVKESKEKEIKENLIQGTAPDFNFCKEIFLKEAKGYYWEGKDDGHLNQLLQKIAAANPKTGIKHAFQSFIQRLPAYWRSKKFTMQHLNQNFNEIANEIQTKSGGLHGTKPVIPQQKTPYTGGQQKKTTPQQVNAGYQQINTADKVQPTHEQQQQTEARLIERVCQEYDDYRAGGSFNIWPMRLAYDLFSRTGVWELNSEQLKKYEEKAIEHRRQELTKPACREDRQLFKNILDSYKAGVTESEKGKIEKLKIELAVRDFIRECKEKNIDLKSLFTQKTNLQ